MNKKKCISVILAATLAVSAFSGCKKEEVVVADLNFGDTYPLQTDVTFSYWVGTGFTPTESYKSFADLPFYKQLYKETGVNVEFIHPVQGSEGDQFNVMIASGEYPDIIQWNFMTGFPGGPAKAIEDEVIIDTTPYLEKYAPNFSKYIKDNPKIDKMVKTDEGQYYCFPTIQGDDYLLVYQGPIVRKDWLDELGLEVPTTLDEWEVMLQAFKDKKGATAPLTYLDNIFTSSRSFIGAFGIGTDFYLNDEGEIEYAYCQPEYKDYLVKMNDWYEKGLLDKNIASVDDATLTSNMVNDKSGACISNTLGGIGKFMTARKDDGTNFEVVAAPYPTLNKGEKPEFAQRNVEVSGAGSCHISTQCANKELAVKWLDYGYSERGALTFNYGIEGESYVKTENGIEYTDLLLNNPDGKGFQEVLQTYASPASWGPFLKTGEYMKAAAQMPQQRASLDIWMDTNMKNHVIPNLTFSQEVSGEVSALQAEIKTYVDEMRFKFIMGVEPIEKFDSYIETLKKIGVDEYINYYKEAYKKFQSR